AREKTRHGALPQSLAANVRHGEVRRRAKQVRRELLIAPCRPTFAIEPNERLLRQLLRAFARTQHVREVVDERVLMAFDECGEGGVVAFVLHLTGLRSRRGLVPGLTTENSGLRTQHSPTQSSVL